MIQMGTKLRVVDNSGALIVECIKVLKSARAAYLGDEIVVSVKKVLSGVRAKGVKEGDVLRAIVTQTRYPTQRLDGSVLSFDQNGAVLLKTGGGLWGTKVGLIPKEVKVAFPDIAFPSKEVI